MPQHCVYRTWNSRVSESKAVNCAQPSGRKPDAHARARLGGLSASVVAIEEVDDHRCHDIQLVFEGEVARVEQV